MEKRINERWTRTAVICGFGGPSIFLIGTVVTAIAFSGRKGESFSPLNHFVSELGQNGISGWAVVFNSGVVLGGVCLAVFLLSMGILLDTSLSRVAGGLGIFAGISCAATGVLTMNHIFPHIAAGDFFFMSGLVCIGMLSVAMVADRRKKFPKWIALVGLLVAASFAAFLYLLVTIHLPQNEALFPAGTTRPLIYSLPVAEWLVYSTVLAWVLSASLIAAGHNRRKCSIR